MEIESTEKVVRFLTGKTLEMEVPKEEYNKQNQLLQLFASNSLSKKVSSALTKTIVLTITIFYQLII